jgi:hypothetical protein
MTGSGQLQEFSWSVAGRKCKAVNTNGITHSLANNDLKVNYIQYEESDGHIGNLLFKSAWITDLVIREVPIEELVSVAWARWMVENETFNTLKNLGY